MKAKRFFLLGCFIIISVIAFEAQAANTGEVLKFNIDSNYDILERKEVSAALVNSTSKIYFYVEKNWWDQQLAAKQNEIINNLNFLSQEFENKIYPTLTSVFGSEWKPGIDGDEKITILFHLTKEDVGGYFRAADEYLKFQAPESNEREMIYLPIAQIDNPQIKTFLSHEFTHLIIFNQKEKTFDVSEETWLNEARAEYALTILGYDNVYDGSNLQRRVRNFLEKPTDSLTEWQNKKYDYATINLFTQYLVDHYSVEILAASLKSKLIGIPSLNEALQKTGFKDNFAQIFTNWTITVFLNDCGLSQNYCYLSKNLENFRISPSINFLPPTSKSTLSVTDVTKNWSGNWQKFIGGNGSLKLEFKGLSGLVFKVPYLIQDKDGNFSANFLTLDKNQKGEINILNFGSQNRSLIIIPSLQTKIAGFDGVEPTYPFTFTVSVTENSSSEQELINKLLAQIEFLKNEINRVQAQINAILGKNEISCQKIQNNLYSGMTNNTEVRCLQKFLKSQGSEIYPEGLITGNFGPLTQAAVIRFQEKYASEILFPSGIEKGNGFVGPKTRAKINEILGR